MTLPWMVLAALLGGSAAAAIPAYASNCRVGLYIDGCASLDFSNVPVGVCRTGLLPVVFQRFVAALQSSLGDICSSSFYSIGTQRHQKKASYPIDETWPDVRCFDLLGLNHSRIELRHIGIQRDCLQGQQ